MKLKLTKTQWIELIGVIISVFFGIFALVFSFQSLGISRASLSVSEGIRQDNRRVEKLDLEAEIKLDVDFKGFKDIPPHFTIGNSGPIDAVQIVVRFISHRYDSTSEKIRLSGYGSEETFSIDKLAPLEYKSFILSEDFLDVNARLQNPQENNILEALIIYRKEPDRELLAKRAVYFINPEGRWVGESDNSLIDDKYNKMKNAWLNHKGPLFIDHSDILHEADPGIYSNDQ